MAAGQASWGQRGIFGADPGHAAQALRLTWGDLDQDTGVDDGRRRARSRDGDGRVLAGDTPDEPTAGFPGHRARNFASDLWFYVTDVSAAWSGRPADLTGIRRTGFTNQIRNPAHDHPRHPFRHTR